MSRTRKTITFIPKHFHPVTMSGINRAWTQIWREIEVLGFACPRLATCQVYLGIVHSAYGYQWFGDRPEGRACGDIVLPRVSVSQFKGYFAGMAKVSVADILRHEYAHAYADVNRRRVETKKFEKAFGYPHVWWENHELEYDPEHHVTRYAATDPAEDFAEVFWKYLKHKGKLPKHHDTPPIRRKWKFVEDLRRI